MAKDYEDTRGILEKVEQDDIQQTQPNILYTSGQLLQKMAFGLVPSFVQRRIHPNASQLQRLHPTSYLDGLRGVASFIVFMGHYTEESLGWWTEPYGMYESGAASSPLQLPIIRALYSARPMVHIFFIISGFVLSYKPIKQIHSQQFAPLSATLASSVFRRALRLFLPSFFTLFIMSISVYLGLSDTRYAPTLESLSEQIADGWNCCWELIRASWAINDLGYPQPFYNPALWTIPVEFAQSLLLFIVVLGLSRCLVNVRLLLLAGVISFCFYCGQMFSVEFLGGVFIAEVTLLQERSLHPTSSPTLLPKFSDPIHRQSDCGTSIKQKAIQTFWFANIITGLFIASWTNNHETEVWGIAYLSAHTPGPYDGQRIWFCFGGFQIVAACTQLRCAQDIFTTGIAQYLGNISYALYLTHNLCLTILEPRLVPILDGYFPKDTFMGRHINWAGGLLLFLPIIICVADLFWRAIDIPSVKFARWLEGKCVVVEKKA